MMRGILISCVGISILYSQEPVLVVSDAVRFALEANTTLQKTSAQMLIAEQEARQQRGSGFPTLNLNSDLSRPGPNLRQDPWLNQASRSQYESVWRTSLQAKWVVFDGGSNTSQWESRKTLVEAAKERVNFQKRNVEVLVTYAYWDLVRQNQLLQLAKQSREYSNERLRLVLARREMGSANLLEEQQALLDRNADSAAEFRQAMLREQARRQLNWYMGKNLEASITVVDSIVPDATNGLFLASTPQADAMPEIREAMRRRESAQASVRAVRSEWLPEVSLYANYNFLEQYSDDPPPPHGHSQGMLYGVQLSMPLYEGGKSTARLQAARETERVQELTVKELREAWERDLALARAQFAQALDLVSLEEGNGLLADSLLAVSLRQFELGAMSGMDLRRVQLSRTDAMERLVTAQFSAKSAEIQLRMLLP